MILGKHRIADIRLNPFTKHVQYHDEEVSLTFFVFTSYHFNDTSIKLTPHCETKILF